MRELYATHSFSYYSCSPALITEMLWLLAKCGNLLRCVVTLIYTLTRKPNVTLFGEFFDKFKHSVSSLSVHVGNIYLTVVL